MKKIPWAKPVLFGNEEELVLEALRSTWISGGPFVDRLEREAAERMGAGHAIAVSNGTMALYLALLGLRIGPGDEVIVPGFTFVAAANMVIAVGAKPIYCDIDPKTWLIDPARIEALITPATRAIIPVHLYGNVADMGAVMDITAKHDIKVIEDAAEAAFSTHQGRCAGTIGDIGTFSFHATKTITTGEGGMVVTSDPQLAARARTLRDHGMRPDKRYWHDVIGYNFRLTNLQAALGCGQLETLDLIIRKRRHIHQTYRQHLEGQSGISLQYFTQETEPVLWAMTVNIDQPDGDNNALTARRDKIMTLLTEEGIETRPGFYALSQLPPYDCPDLPVCSSVAAGLISLPTFVNLGEDDIVFICAGLTRALQLTGRSNAVS